MPAGAGSRLRLAGVLLLRLLPALAALAIPFLSPGLREAGPFVGADWLRTHPESLAGRTVWIRCYLPDGHPPPRVGDRLQTAALGDRRTSLGGGYLFVRGALDPSGTRLEVVDLNPQGEEMRAGMLVQTLLGGLVLLGLLVAFFRPAPGWTVEVRPWIR